MYRGFGVDIFRCLTAAFSMTLKSLITVGMTFALKRGLDDSVELQSINYN